MYYELTLASSNMKVHIKRIRSLGEPSTITLTVCKDDISYSIPFHHVTIRHIDLEKPINKLIYEVLSCIKSPNLRVSKHRTDHDAFVECQAHIQVEIQGRWETVTNVSNKDTAYGCYWIEPKEKASVKRII